MKKHGIISKSLIIAAMALSLTACGNKEQTTTAVAGTEEQATKAETDTAAASTEQGTEASTKEADASANWVFKKDGVTIELNAPAEPVIQALGAAQNTYEAPSCAFDGMDVIYVYPGYEVLTYAKDGNAIISGVVLRDDTVSTPEGAYIGMTKADVENLYGQKANTAGSLQVDKGNCTLLFIFTDEAVTSIQYNMLQQ